MFQSLWEPGCKSRSEFPRDGGNTTRPGVQHDVCAHVTVWTLFVSPADRVGVPSLQTENIRLPQLRTSRQETLCTRFGSAVSHLEWGGGVAWMPTSDQSRASHSGGQLWLLQGSVREGRRGLHAESSRTFSSVTEILLLHKTCRVRRPPLQLRLHSDHSPVHQLQAHKCSTRAN